MKTFKNTKTGETLEQNLLGFFQDRDGNTIPARFVEGSCDWEEVIQNYRILSLITQDNNLVTRRDNGKFVVKGSTKEGIFDVDILLANDLNIWMKEYPKHFDEYQDANLVYRIHSVERLSDGEIFTLGDEVEYSVFGRWGSKSKITKFTITDNRILIGTNGDWKWAYLSDTVRKAKEPIFISEDGVGIFDGSEYYTIFVTGRKGYDTWIVNGKFIADGVREDYNFVDLKYFSTKEAAEEYILMKGNHLSLDDLLSVWGSGMVSESDREAYLTSPMFRAFKELAQKKINK